MKGRMTGEKFEEIAISLIKRYSNLVAVLNSDGCGQFTEAAAAILEAIQGLKSEEEKYVLLAMILESVAGREIIKKEVIIIKA